MQLTLNWPLDRDGYHIDSVEPGYLVSKQTVSPPVNLGPPPPRAIWVKDKDLVEVIVRNGGPLCSRPVVAPALYEKLAACTANAKGALNFSRKFGLLYMGHFEFMGVEDFCKEVRLVRRLIALAKKGDWEKIAKSIAGEEADSVEYSSRIELSGSIGYDEAGDPHLEFRPQTLIGFIYTQLIQDYTTGAQYKLCKRPGCGEYFYYGPGTGKRNTAEYCSTKCQGAHAYKKRKGESK